MASQQIIFAGFGGQGILSMGKFLAYAGMDANLNVSWLPSYGPEMRGGTANCSVILTNEDIGSPIVLRADSIVVMNRPSLEKFENSVEPGGIIVMDSDLIDIVPNRNDVKIIAIPAQTIAEEIGSKKIANMILLGTLVKETGIVSIEQLLNSLKEHGKEKFFESNRSAVERGIEFVK
ncbi:2-oxoacid:acceptor oxidoreductase family protein [Clostridium luticellarii]|uniref:Pyruvate synthase subunit PorC n=1 Tax=Clostridium luticellarii TaxID=1691940 RepID=A0A2T0BSB0_9CLOT|nr:2-oxoacid:acceptor oxidoreductase family protein [Clostridium luticellarii]MCI1945571.1 2-oxoacid:acceptor oxidoreductase family protein [Clostridium luticellarii]MCI1968870.1 2-oxoacid:acceptor oxidoreductase family protein [Clostridium luticellarii]MCI1996515.1 2-oxoacid:acceptor oxidoreductase family protein [Clostridium luticellarii]PRR86774.1 Pyruvate synthase subunit PorC [Clostridium luticellarii]